MLALPQRAAELVAANNRVKAAAMCRLFTFLVIAIAVGTNGGSISPAAALATTWLRADITTNEVYQYDTARYWGVPFYAFQTPTAGTQGGTLVIGLRNRDSYQFARAEARHNQTVRFHTDNGGIDIPSGIFYINAKSTGACGGGGCGVFGFETYFEWGI